MRFVLDLHVHSRFARGCSKDLSIKNLAKWAKVKGVDVLGTGDFTYPGWWEELERELVREEDGIAYTADGMAFVYQVEIALIYTQGRGRRIHLVILAPNKAAAAKVREHLGKYGRLDADGRPIFNVPAWRVAGELAAIDERIEIIPAHAWTPWFSVFGSKSGFDSLRECFLRYSDRIHAIETGMSSDILMNERLSALDSVRKVSFSDAHSYWPWRLGREATIIDVERLSYDSIIDAIRTGKGFVGTIEVPPAYGKYHWDGHRLCNRVQDPATTRANGKACPVCGQELTIGVQYRVDQLADRPEVTQTRLQTQSVLIPLSEIIAMVLGKGIATKAVWDEYWRVLKAGRNEIDVLLNATRDDLLRTTLNSDLIEAILNIRSGNVSIDPPGYDGVYGKPKIPGIALNIDNIGE